MEQERRKEGSAINCANIERARQKSANICWVTYDWIEWYSLAARLTLVAAGLPLRRLITRFVIVDSQLRPYSADSFFALPFLLVVQ